MIPTVHKNGAQYAPAADAALSLSTHAKPKYHLRDGKEYLHWSVGFLTTDRKHAWSGTFDQAKACRRTFSAAAKCRIAAISTLPQHSEEA